jgi:hypothetical protein
MKTDIYTTISNRERKLIVIIGEDEKLKDIIKEFAEHYTDYEIIKNPENDLHPIEQVKMTEDIIIDLNTTGQKKVVFTNSAYFVDHLSGLMKAHRLVSKGRPVAIDKFLRKNNMAFISVKDIAVFEATNDKIKSILNYKTEKIHWETFSNVSDFVCDLWFTMDNTDEEE